jgi:superfamily II DNA or RNA helicase
MREHQQECHDKAVKALTELNFDKFLIGAVMRFGKTFTAYQIMRSLNVDTTLIITSKPNDVRGAWRAELEDHVDFADYTFYDIRDCTQDIAKIPGKKVIFTSVQYLQNTTGAVNKDWAYDLNVDLLMFDEEHHGSKTEDAKNILERLNPSKTLAISGGYAL